MVGVNRVGTGDGHHYTGDSVILDPMGRPLAEASLTETVLLADLTADEVKRVRDRFPFLADRRGPAGGSQPGERTASADQAPRGRPVRPAATAAGAPGGRADPGRRRRGDPAGPPSCPAGSARPPRRCRPAPC